MSAATKQTALPVRLSLVSVEDYLAEELDGPITRLAAADTHIPYAPSLEEAILPNAEDVVQAVRRLAEY